jgi:hypothetical protein
MRAFRERYTKQQREAVAFAYVELGIRPAKRVADLAAAGRLTLDGLLLDAFEMPVSTIRHQVRNYRKRAAAGGDLETLPHRDAIERLRVDLVTAASRVLADYSRQAKRDASKADPERGRQIVRMVREAAALPALNESRPSAPGSMRGGVRNGSETRGGLAEQILRAHRGSRSLHEPSGEEAVTAAPIEVSSRSGSLPRG